MTSIECKIFRRRARLTQVELADKIGVTRETLSRWERGTRSISFCYALRIMNACGQRMCPTCGQPLPVIPACR